jgi:hypothetical protein
MRDENNQISTGHGAIQIHGNHNTVNQYNHHQHDHHHTHIEAASFALQAPPAPPAHYRQRGQPAADITPAQKALLALMRPLPKPARAQVLDFMRVEFGTGLVVQLDPNELQQVRRMVLDARRAAGC